MYDLISPTAPEEMLNSACVREKLKKVSNTETLWWPKVLFHVVFADRGTIRNFLPFRYFASVVFINVSVGKWQTTFTSINLLLAINVKAMNDLLVVELIFQFAPFGRIDSLLSI